MGKLKHKKQRSEKSDCRIFPIKFKRNTADGDLEITLLMKAPHRRLEQRLQNKFNVPVLKNRVLYYAKRLAEKKGLSEQECANVEESYIRATTELEDASMSYKIVLYSLLITNKNSLAKRFGYKDGEDFLDSFDTNEWLWIDTMASIAFLNVPISELYMEILHDVKTRIQYEKKEYAEDVLGLISEIEGEYLDLSKKNGNKYGGA